MRKIESNMLKAVHANANWAQANTRVEQGVFGPDVYLHNNLIAYSRPDGFRVCVNTLCQYPTATTKSRLRALGFDVVQSRGVIYLNGEKLTYV